MEKLTELDFKEASRIAIKTKRRIRYIKYLDSDYYMINEWSNFRLHDPEYEALILPNNQAWWPTLAQQKNKVWEVEPEKADVINLAPGLDLQRGEDGYWMSFQSEKLSACISLVNISAGRVIQNAILGWAKDQFEKIDPEENTVKENWPGKPEKCVCGRVLEDKDFKVLTCVDTDNRPVYLEVFCDCARWLLVDTDGQMKQIMEY